MSSVVLNAEVDEFRVGKIRGFIDAGIFKNEQDFLQSAIDEMIKRVKINRLNKDMDKFAYHIARHHKKSLSDSIIEARREEDERL